MAEVTASVGAAAAALAVILAEDAPTLPTVAAAMVAPAVTSAEDAPTSPEASAEEAP